MDSERLARVIDRSAIEELMVRYARGVDRIDIPLIKSAFWPGAMDEHGTFNGLAVDFADYLNSSLRAFEASQHALTNFHMEFHGDQADVESYFIATHVMKPEFGGWRFVLGGRYLDQLEKRQGEWKILFRRLVRDWADIPEGAENVRALLDRIERRAKPMPDDPWYSEILSQRR